MSLSKFRTDRYKAMIKADRESGRKAGTSKVVGSHYRHFCHELSAVLVTKAIILGPLERLKIVMQVSPIAKYVNPKSDKPKGIIDLFSKVTHNQGMFAFYRGTNALIYKLSVQYGVRFLLYENIINTTLANDKSSEVTKTHLLLASIGTALVTTTLAYPLDLAQGRMAADMSKKPSLY